MAFDSRFIYFGIVFIIFNFCEQSYGSPFDKVIDSACRTNPTLTICIPTKSKLKDDVIPESSANDVTSAAMLSSIEDTKNITDVDTELLSLNETTTSASTDLTTEEEPKNLSPDISPKDMVFQAASFLKNESLLNNASETSVKAAATGNELEVLKENYCHTYITNFTNYCHGKERFRLPEILQTRLSAFCDSFKTTCYPLHSVPCTPDCDQRFHAHCTVACKCNYMYPFVIKFCSPVTIHSLEDVCRSWFIRCAKIHFIDD